MKKSKLGELLVGAGMLTQDALDGALNRKEAQHMRLGEYLCSRGLIREEQVVDMLCRQLHVPRFSTDLHPVDIELSALLPVEAAQRHHVVPLRREGTILKLAMSDPTDTNAIDTA